MSRALFLTRRMKRGYGVDLEVHEISTRLTERGHSVTVLCLETDGSFKGPYEVQELAFAALTDVLEYAEPFRPQVVTAFTSPFIEMLPSLSVAYNCWAWENGDPTPALFPHDAKMRQEVKRHKTESCYPRLTGVLAISEFIRRDIDWPSAHVVYLGSDHAPDLGEKDAASLVPTGDRPLRVGTLMRLGKSESNYKGNREILSLAEMMSRSGLPVEFSVMGSGKKKDARDFQTAGFEVGLNTTDEEKWAYLRALDVFVSCSLWEGFNLPLVEAQALGTMGVALGTGAHPEVTPLVFSTTHEIFTFLDRCAKDPNLLFESSRNAYRFVRHAFRWGDTATRFEELVLSSAPHEPGVENREGIARLARPGAPELRRSGPLTDIIATLKSARNYGWRVTARKIKRKLGG